METELRTGPTPGGLFFAAGLAATTVQVLSLRELMVSAAGDEASLGTGLAAGLAGIAAGAAIARRRRDVAHQALRALALLALAPLLSMVALRLLRFAWAPPVGQLPRLEAILATAVATLLPAGALVGFLFAALAAHASQPPAAAAATAERATGALVRLYVGESGGSLLGGLLVGLFVGTLLSPLAAGILGGMAALLVATVSCGPRSLGRGPLITALVLLAAALPFSPRLDLATEKARFAGTAPGVPLVAFADTPSAHLDLGGDDVRHLYESGQYAATFPDPYTGASLGHLVASLTESARNVLAVSGVETGPLPFLLQHGVQRLDLLAQDPAALSLIRRWAGDELRRALADPRVRVVEEDPRRFLLTTEAAFDLIVVLAGDPVTVLRARLATVEFYRACAARLAPRGALVLSLRTAPATLTGETAALAGSVVHALLEAFPVVRITPGPESLVVAGFDGAAVTLDPAVLAARFRSRGIRSDSFVPELFDSLLPPGRVAQFEASVREASAAAPASRDDRPASFLFALSRRQLETGSAIGQILAAIGRLPAPLLASAALAPSLLLALSALVRRPSLRLAALHACVAGGAAGMMSSLLLLFSYQLREGALYGTLGLLTAFFMAGVALGAIGAERAWSAFPWSGRMALLAALAFSALVGLTLAGLLPLLGRLAGLSRGISLGAHAALLFLAGGSTGALAPAAFRAFLAGRATALGTAAVFETADHAGAAIAALLAGVVLVPALGLQGTALVATSLVVLAGVVAGRSL